MTSQIKRGGEPNTFRHIQSGAAVTMEVLNSINGFPESIGVDCLTISYASEVGYGYGFGSGSERDNVGAAGFYGTYCEV